MRFLYKMTVGLRKSKCKTRSKSMKCHHSLGIPMTGGVKKFNKTVFQKGLQRSIHIIFNRAPASSYFVLYLFTVRPRKTTTNHSSSSFFICDQKVQARLFQKKQILYFISQKWAAGPHAVQRQKWTHNHSWKNNCLLVCRLR